MKKIISMILALTMIISSMSVMVACGSGTPGDSETKKPSTDVSDKGDKEADTATNSVAQIDGNGVHNRLAYIRDGEQDKDKTLDKYRRKCKLPRVSHAKAYCIYEERI